MPPRTTGLRVLPDALHTLRARRLRVMTKNWLWAVCAVLTATSLLTAVGSAAAARHAPAATAAVAVKDCGLGARLVRPRSLILACADANTQAVHLVWSSWGTVKATATGTYTWNTCVPDCAASTTWDKTTAELTLSDPVKTTTGWLFERLTVHITGPAPHDIARITTYSEAPHTS